MESKDASKDNKKKMESLDLLSIEDGCKKKPKTCWDKSKSILYKIFKPFMVAGERRVARPRFEAKDFELPSKMWVAKYDPKIASNYWNDQNLPRRTSQIVAQLFFKGIYIKLVPIFLLYLTQYYLLNYLIFNNALCQTQANLPPNHSTGNIQANIGQNDTHCPSGSFRLALSNDMCCDETKVKSWK